MRTYTTMLQSSGEIKVESLVQAHLGMGSVLHPLAAQPQTDMGALLYTVRRLPTAISHCRRVIMGQSPQGFKAVLDADILSWEAVKAPARRRRWYHDGDNTLAVLIASTSDIDDLVPTLVAFQIEWNKLHRLLQDVDLSDEDARQAAGASPDDWRRLHEAWGESFDANLAAMHQLPFNERIERLSQVFLGTPYGEIQQRHPEVMMGSYPFFNEKGFFTRLILRARDAAKLTAAQREVEAMVEKLRAEKKIGA